MQSNDLLQRLGLVPKKAADETIVEPTEDGGFKVTEPEKKEPEVQNENGKDLDNNETMHTEDPKPPEAGTPPADRAEPGDVDCPCAEVMNMLRSAMNAKLQGSYLYYWCALTVVGPHANQLRKEFADHAEEELELAHDIGERLYQLGGLPTFNPANWGKTAACAYPKLDKNNQFSTVQIAQLIEEERCAIEYNEKLIKLTKDTDSVTNDLMIEVNKADYDHITDLKKAQKDIQLSKGESIDEIDIQVVE